MNLRTRILFYRQFSTMLDSGLPLLRVLDEFERGTHPAAVRRIATVLRDGIAAGQSLTEAMHALPASFSPLETSGIRAGEKSGKLPEVLATLASHFEAMQRLRTRLVSGMLYPLVLIHIAILLPGLPALFTKGLGGYLAAVLPGVLLLYGGAGVVLVLRLLPRTSPTLAMWWSRVKIFLPVFGRLSRAYALLRFLRSFLCLYEAGVQVAVAMRLAAAAMDNPAMARAVEAGLPAVEAGEPLSVALAANPYVPRIVLDMLRTGEESGKLDEMLVRVATYLQQDADTTVDRISVLLPLLVYLLVAGYIAFVVISFYAGYFRMISEAAGG